jgi:hypothetical protein
MAAGTNYCFLIGLNLKHLVIWKPHVWWSCSWVEMFVDGGLWEIDWSVKRIPECQAISDKNNPIVDCLKHWYMCTIYVIMHWVHFRTESVWNILRKTETYQFVHISAQVFLWCISVSNNQLWDCFCQKWLDTLVFF